MKLRVAMWVCVALGAACVAFADTCQTREVRRPLPPRRPPRGVVSCELGVVSCELGVGGGETVDVLVAYDLFAERWVRTYGGVTNFAEQAVARMNAALTNSNLHADLAFRLAGVTVVSDVGGTDFDGVLDDVTWGLGAWSVVRTQRDERGADIAVTLIDTGSAYGVTGLSWALYDDQDATFADYAFSVCSIRAVAECHTMTHEVGHLFGAGHSNLQAQDPGPLLRPYSSGYYFVTNGAPCRTIMAYDDDGYGGYYEETPYFSAPDVFAAEGVAVGTPTNDNARTLRETAGFVAGFRPSLPDSKYGIRFYADGAASFGVVLPRDAVSALSCPAIVAACGRRPVGWACSNGKRYDDGVLVFNLAPPGRTVTMTAIWK